MGEVYRARDLTLGREVAIKALPAEVSSDPQRLARFRREAEFLAALSHPNIGAIFGLEEESGRPLLVLELVPGETLADRVEIGAVPAAEAVDVGRQVVAALEAAHARGIVHRDLKPANVKRDAKGRVRVLDFGLAVAYEEYGILSTEDVSKSPTMTARLTRDGSVLGTAPYMSPELVRGQEVDPRSDIWALGCLLFELLSGRAPFARASLGETLAAVLDDQPEWSALPSSVSRPFRRFLRRCLEKDPDQRWHHAADVRIALEEIAEDPGSPSGESPRPSGYGPRALLASALGALALGGVLLWPLWPRPEPTQAPPTVSFSFRLPLGFRLEGTSPSRAPVEISPDGSFVVFSARAPDQRPQIYRRSLDAVEIVAVAGTEGGRQPFVSPDSRWIGFFTQEGGLARVPAEGGLAQRIFDRGRLMPMGAYWAPGDRIFFPRGLTGGLGVVSSSSRGYQVLTVPDYQAGEIGHWHPQLLPGGRELLFGAWTVDGWRNQILDLDSGEARSIDHAGRNLRYLDSGHLVWLDARDLVAAPFDLGASRLVGEAKAVLSGIASFEVSRNGSLVYVTRLPAAVTAIPTRWSAEDEGLAALDGAGRGTQMRLSPEGLRLAIATFPHLWIVELDRGVRSRFTTDGVVNNFPIWSRDGTQVLFSSIRDPHGLYLRSADGLGDPRLVLERGTTEIVFLPASWGPDGRSVAMTELHPDGKSDVAVLHLDSGARESLVSSEALEHSPAFSPDGRWLAYASDESGRDEVYLRPYPGEGRRVTISNSGGTDPRWSPDGHHLLFRRGPVVYEVAIDLAVDEGAVLRPGTPRRRAELPSFLEPTVPYGPTWDIAPNGDLVYLRAPSDPGDTVEISVVVGWSRDLPSARRSGQLLQ